MRTFILLLAFFSFSASAQQYSKWRVYESTSDNDTLVAETINDSNQTFGKVCTVSTQTCWWALAIDPTCEHEAKYPIMVNASNGAYSLTMICVDVGKGEIMAFEDFDAIDKIARGPGIVGFALPMESGEFRVFRFNLSGSTQAADKVGELTARRKKDSTRDLSL